MPYFKHKTKHLMRRVPLAGILVYVENESGDNLFLKRRLRKNEFLPRVGEDIYLAGFETKIQTVCHYPPSFTSCECELDLTDADFLQFVSDAQARGWMVDERSIDIRSVECDRKLVVTRRC